jgi:hypothetical protein
MISLELERHEMIGTYSVDNPATGSEWTRRYAHGLARVLASDVIGELIYHASVTKNGAHIILDCEDDENRTLEHEIRERWAGRLGTESPIGI